MFPLMFLVIFLFLAASPHATTLPPGKGKVIVQRTCTSCHALKVVTTKRASKEQWSTLVDQMMSKGADLEDDEVDIVVDYLAKNFSRAKGPAGAEKNHSQATPKNTKKATPAD